MAPVIAGMRPTRRPARVGVDRSAARDRGSPGSLALALGEQRAAVRRTELRETGPALVDGLDEILHFGIEDLDYMPGIGSAVCGSYHLVGYRHPQTRKSQSCQSARSETTAETRQRFSAHSGVGLAPHSRLDRARRVRIPRREGLRASRGVHGLWVFAGFVLFLRPEFATRSRSSDKMRGKPGGIPGPGRLGGGVDVSVSADALAGGRRTALAYRGTAPGGSCCQGGHAAARSCRGENSATPAVYRGLAKNDPAAS